MTFAAPLFLLAALAGLIPVLVHLIHRQKARVVHFSTLRFCGSASSGRAGASTSRTCPSWP